MKGTLAPNSTETLSCIFAPKIAKNWFIRIPCFFAHENEGKALRGEQHEEIDPNIYL